MVASVCELVSFVLVGDEGLASDEVPIRVIGKYRTCIINVHVPQIIAVNDLLLIEQQSSSPSLVSHPSPVDTPVDPSAEIWSLLLLTHPWHDTQHAASIE